MDWVVLKRIEEYIKKEMRGLVLPYNKPQFSKDNIRRMVPFLNQIVELSAQEVIQEIDAGDSLQTSIVKIEAPVYQKYKVKVQNAVDIKFQDDNSNMIAHYQEQEKTPPEVQSGNQFSRVNKKQLERIQALLVRYLKQEINNAHRSHMKLQFTQNEFQQMALDVYKQHFPDPTCSRFKASRHWSCNFKRKNPFVVRLFKK